MINNEIRSLIILGDDIYADMASAYLAAQMPAGTINIVRLVKSELPVSGIIDTDHSIHAFHEEIGLVFDDLYRRNIMSPSLVCTEKFAQTTAYLESHIRLKDDLPLPRHQLAVRLVREGIANSCEAISPLVALHNANKFHPHLHRFYNDDLRPYGARLHSTSYSALLREKSLSQSVNFLQYKTIDFTVNSESIIEAACIDNCHDVQNAFFLDMSKEQVVMSCLKTKNERNIDVNLSGMFWFGNCLSLEQLKLSMVKPANYFEWLYRSLVRFVDFFPDWSRMSVLAKEYNRLQTRDYKQLTEFSSIVNYFKDEGAATTLPDAIKHSKDLFAQSCQLSQGGANLAYASYWPSIMIAAGVVPQQLPRRVNEIPLHYLKSWYDRRQRNIEEIVRRAP